MDSRWPLMHSDRLPCDEKYVQVRLKDVKRGTYKLQIETKFDFSSYSYTLIDNYFHSETPLRPGKEIDLEITDDPTSKSSDRLALRLNEIIPIDSLYVRAQSSVCGGAIVSGNYSKCLKRVYIIPFGKMGVA